MYDRFSCVEVNLFSDFFRAYEHVYNLLSYTFLPLFHQSEHVSIVFDRFSL